MKKILLCVSLLSMFAAGFVGCSQKREWNHEQRKAMREALRSYRQMVYLDDLTDAEFVLFTDQVAGELAGTYPVYATFVEMPGVTDTVDMVVVTTIVDELNADARNMRHIFPYNYLVAQGVLPAGLDHDQQKAFYNCFAGKVNDTYDTMSQFFKRHPGRYDRHVAAAPVAGAVRQRPFRMGDYRSRRDRERQLTHRTTKRSRAGFFQKIPPGYLYPATPAA